MAFITAFFQSNFLTSKLDNTLQKKLANAMKPCTYEMGDTIIKYGDDGSEYFLLVSGTV